MFVAYAGVPDVFELGDSAGVVVCGDGRSNPRTLVWPRHATASRLWRSTTTVALLGVLVELAQA